MPKKRGYKKRRGAKKMVNRPSRNLKSPSSYFFTRKTQDIVALQQGIPVNWSNTSNGGISRAWAFSLAQLNDASDFQDLFKYYRINSARVQIYFSTTQSDLDNAGDFTNHALICMTDRNMNGVTTGLDTQDFLDSQTAKIRQCMNTRKPFEFYCKLKQANEVYNTATNTDYTLMKPKFIATTEDTTPHYGLKTLIERIDGDTLTSGMSNKQYMRVITTYYIECKKVH